MQKIRRKFCPSCLRLDKSVHLVTTSGRNVQWRVAVVVDYVGVCTGPQDHRQGVLQRCHRCQDSFLLLVDLAVARNCCVDRCVSLTIRDISCCPLSTCCQKKSIAIKQRDWKPCRGETELLLYGRPQLLCGEGFDQRCPGWKLFLKREFEKTCLMKNIWIRLNTNLIQEKRFNWTKQFDESKCTASGFRLCKKTDQGGLLNEKKVLYTHYSEKNKITKNIVPNSSNKAKSLTSDLHLWIRFCAH